MSYDNHALNSVDFERLLYSLSFSFPELKELLAADAAAKDSLSVGGFLYSALGSLSGAESPSHIWKMEAEAQYSASARTSGANLTPGQLASFMAAGGAS